MHALTGHPAPKALASEHASPDFPGQPVGASATRLFINTTFVASLWLRSSPVFPIDVCACWNGLFLAILSDIVLVIQVLGLWKWNLHY